MSYIYCPKCDWQQDDFWDRGYNPIRFFLRNELQYIRPRMIDFDPPPNSYGRVHSWYVLWRSIRKWVLRIVRQRWWTYRSWRKDVERGKGGCPKCGTVLGQD